MGIGTLKAVKSLHCCEHRAIVLHSWGQHDLPVEAQSPSAKLNWSELVIQVLVTMCLRICGTADSRARPLLFMAVPALSPVQPCTGLFVPMLESAHVSLGLYISPAQDLIMAGYS